MHYRDAKGILSADNNMNPYRGCTHGCIYCDARSLCYGMEHIFEDVEVKRNAPELLEDALRRRRRRCMIGMGAMCDPYLPIERTEGLTRRCLEVIERRGFGVHLLTKSTLVLRDIDLFRRIASRARCVVQMTLTTADEGLCRIVEPNVATTRERFEALCTLRDAGIETAVWLCPILPFINDTEDNLRAVLDCCFRAGVGGIVAFDMGLTLRDGDREYYYQKLDEHFPGMKRRYMAAYGRAYELPSPNRDALWRVFDAECAAHGVMHRPDEVFRWLHALRPEEGMREQLSLF